jgi:type IV pilus assembly protein PilW
MCKKIKKKKDESGFTLVELLIAVAISGIVLGAVFLALKAQQESYVMQEQVSSMQQNLRNAMYYMASEIRMAGCDPTHNAGAGMINANNNSIRFTLDITDDTGNGNPDGDTGDTNEDITFALADNDGDGDNDLERNNNLIAENIDALNFVYLDENGVQLDDDGNGNVTTSRSQIVSVQITMVARAERRDLEYMDTTIYQNQQGQTILGAQNDDIHRRRLTSEITCRNL